MAKCKVRTGCRTCKIRKVKCDESYPVCHRCSSTGRTCDGYGVWGGGGIQSNRSSRDRAIIASTSSSSNETCNTILPRPRYVSFFVATREDKECFDWFERRTSPKIRGSFDSEFWSKLILQASINELAVRHAVVAVSFIHRRGSLNVMDTRLEEETIGQVEQVPLRYFARSINNLQHHLSANTQASLRIVLITCIIFTTLGLLRGHFETARIHVRNGVYLVRRLRSFSNRDDGLHSTRVSESTDSWITEAFMRLHGQVEVHNLMNRVTCEPLLPDPSPLPSIQNIRSVKEAWNHLDKILEHILHQQSSSCMRDRVSSSTSPSSFVKNRPATDSNHTHFMVESL
ncbi:transcriptional regulatory protein moc3 [Lipomyces kononenkoae]